MKPHPSVRALSALLGGSALAGMGLFAVAAESPDVASLPSTVVISPVTDETTESDAAPATTSTIPSFRPSVTASIPPPPD